MIVKQASNLVYRIVDDKYYVTNVNSREMIILNQAGFNILEQANEKTVEEICSIIQNASGGQTDSLYNECAVSKEDVEDFISQLNLIGLLEFVV